MGYASVDIEALAALVKNVEGAGETITTEQTSIVDALDGSPISTSGLSVLPEIASWLDDQAPTLRTQLGYARWLDASTPGVQKVVGFDQASVPELSEDRAKELAERARELMEVDGPPSPELIDLLQTYGGNPQFALFLMDGYREGEGSATMTAGPSPDLDYIANLPKGPESEKFLQLYSQALGGLSEEFPWNSLGPPSGDNNPDPYRAWALLASRGNWDKGWLTGLGQDLIDAEKADPDLWTNTLHGGEGDGTYETINSVVDPTSGLELHDPMVWLMDALSRNPEAARDLFLGGGDAPIKSDGDEVDIAANLRFLTLERPWPQDGALSLSLALGAAKSLGDDDFDHDFDALENLDPLEKASWYSFAAHLGLDIIGLVPGLGEWADGLNVSLSLAEGDYAGAAASAAGAVPVFGSTATIAKWINRVNKAGDAAGAVLNADDLRELLSELDLTNQDPDAVAPAKPPEDVTFLDPGGQDADWYDDLRRPRPDQTYLLPDGTAFTTDGQGRITDVTGDLSGLSAGERAWIRQHRA